MAGARAQACVQLKAPHAPSSHVRWGRGRWLLLLHTGTLQISSPGKELVLRCHSMPACFLDAQGMVEVKPKTPGGWPVP